MHCSLVLLLLCTPALPSPAVPAQQPDLHQELTALVDLPTPAARRARAKELAKLREVELEQWREAMRDFGAFGEVRPGLSTHRAQLQVGDEAEDTELAVFLPSQYDPAQPAPAMLLLHGAGGDGAGMIAAWRAFADDSGMLLLAPTDRVGSGGYTFQERERLAALAALRWLRRRYNVDEDRIHLSGISRGAHLGWDLALRYPDRWATFSPMIGGPSITLAEGRNNLRFVENLVPVPVRCLQGAEDDPRLLRNQRLAFERLHRAGARDAVHQVFPDLGHAFRMEAVPWQDFLLDHARDPDPSRVEHRCVREAESRSAWLEITRFERTVKEDFKPKVDAKRWNAAGDETARLRLIQEQADAHTARITVERTGRGAYRAEGQGVKKFRLLLSPEHIGEDGRVSVSFGGKTKKLKPKPSKLLLLEEFAERFDRGFLPVAAVEIG